LRDRNPSLGILIDSLDRAQVGAVLLKEWNLPDVVWQSIKFQFYPEFSLPANVPADIRLNVAVLYLAHLCNEFLRGNTAHDLPTLFLDQYLLLLNWGKLSVPDITQRFVLPDLIRKWQSLPQFLRELIEQHHQQAHLSEVHA